LVRDFKSQEGEADLIFLSQVNARKITGTFQEVGLLGGGGGWGCEKLGKSSNEWRMGRFLVLLKLWIDLDLVSLRGDS